MCPIGLATDLNGRVNDAENVEVSKQFLFIPNGTVNSFEFFPASRLAVELVQ
jgi:hypothetical protein